MGNNKPANRAHARYVAVSATYHTPNCPKLANIPPERMRTCRNPILEGLQPCPTCIKFGDKNYHPPKTEVLKEAITELATKYNMYAEFSGSVVFIKTIAGEWYFDFCCNPIQLHHKNLNVNGWKTKGYYHVQKDKSFDSPLLAIAYIYKHEQAAIKRLMETEELIHTTD